MTAPASLAEAWDLRVADEAITTRTSNAQVQGRRDFMAGAMAALALQQQGRTPAQLRDECLQWARTIGTAAEAAHG